MQTRSSFLKLILGLTFVNLGILLSQSASAAVGVSITPTAISNQYTGYITIQITNLTAGAAAVVQKFADVNSNGIVDAGDVLVQQFQIRDGQPPALFSGITNVNIPFDLNPTSGAITTQLSPATEGSVQRFVGQFLFVISSPTSQFTPVTNTFLVTNTAYGQKFTGTVTAGGSNIPNALVFLARPPSSQDNGFNPLGGVIADSAGNYKIKAAPGTYRLLAFKSGFVANLSAAPVLTLGNGATITTNLVMSTATRTISGTLVDAGNNSLGLPAILMAAQSNSKDLGLGATDTNGNFVLPALAEQFGFGEEEQSLDFHGYLGINNSPTNVDATAGNVTGVTIAFPKATAIIYGSVLDNNGNPLSGVRLFGDNETNSSGPYQGDATTDPNGNYSMGVDADLWSPGVDNGNNSITFRSYIFSQGPLWVFNNGGPGTNVSTGAAIRADFGAVLATNQITGFVKDNNNNPIVGVQVNANATISGVSYQSQQNTDSNGNYSLNVANGNWNVYVFCCCDNNSLQSLGNYQCPNNTNVNISNGNGVANFTVQTNGGGGSYQLDGYVMDNIGNPVVGVNVYANNGQGGNLSTSTDGTGYYQFTVGNGNWNVSVDCGGLTSQGYGCVSSQQIGISNGNYDNLDFTVQTCGALAIITTSLPDGMVGANYSAQLQNDGCNSPFTWSLTPGSLPLPAGLGISTNGVIAGTPTSAPFGGTTNYFSIRVTDAQANTTDQLLSIAVYPTLTIASNALPNGTNGFPYTAQVLVTGGNEYYIGNTPDGYSLTYNGSVPPGLNIGYGATTVSNQYLVISGTPTNTGTFSFTLGAQDADNNQVQRNVSITIISSSLQISSASPLAPATVGANYANQLQGSGGTPPYNWSIALGSQPLPPNLSLSTNGVISGMPTTAGTNNFIVRITDHNAVTTTKSFTLIVKAVARPNISSPLRLSNRQFQFTVNGVAGQNYTVQSALGLTGPGSWSTLVVTNPGVSSFTVTDPNATNGLRFYRVMVGP